MGLKQVKLGVIAYIDKFIVLLLVGLFAASLYHVLIKRDPKVKEIRADIERYRRKVSDNIRTSKPPPLEKLNHARILSERFAHIPVVEPYRRYVLYPPEPVTWAVFRLVMGKDARLTIHEVQLVKVVHQDKEILKVKGIEAVDPDIPGKGSVVVVQSLKPTFGTPRPETSLVVQDVDDIRYVAKVIVYEKVPPKKPKPPKDPKITLVKGKVLVEVWVDNPVPMPRSVATTAGLNIYRKLAERPDSEYRLLTEKAPVAPNPDAVDRIKRTLKLDEYAEGEESATTDEGDTQERTKERTKRKTGRKGGRTPEEDEIEDAVAVDPRRDRKTGRAEDLVKKELEEKLRDRVWYLDATVSPGETYVYKVVAVTAPINELRMQSEPWVSSPIAVPSDVQFALSAVRGMSASIKVWKRDYDLDVWHEKTYSLGPGMKIGRVEPRFRVRKKTEDGFKMVAMEVDFSTGYVVSGVFEKFPVLKTKMVWRRRAVGGAMQNVREFVVGAATAEAVVVMDPDGKLSLRFKDRSRRGQPRKRPTRRRTRRKMPAEEGRDAEEAE